MIFGREDILINNIAYILRRLPVFGIPGSGSYRLRPVSVEDVAEICCVRSGLGGSDEVMDAVGPETFTFEELVRLIARVVGRRRLFVCVPAAAAPDRGNRDRTAGWRRGGDQGRAGGSHG